MRVVAALVALLLSCDRAPATLAAAPSASARAHDAGRPPAPPKIMVDGRGCTVDDKAFAGAPEVWRDGVEELLAKKPLVAGEAVEVTVSPGARMPRVVAIVGALAGAKAKSVVIRSQTRAGLDAQLTVGFPAPSAPGCAVHVTVQHDLNVTVAGGGAHPERVARGDLGLDAEKVSAAVRKRLATCDARTWTLSGADSVPWAVAFEIFVDLLHDDGGTHGATPALVPYVRADGGR